jgi:hypothetical protein
MHSLDGSLCLVALKQDRRPNEDEKNRRQLRAVERATEN